MNFATDIPADLARAAHAGTSFDPETRGRQEIDAYAGTLGRDYFDLGELADKAPDPTEARARLDEEFARYRIGYRRRYLVTLARRARCMSTMITGPSNFPTARNQKNNAAEHRALEALVEFRKRAFNAMRKAIRPDLAPIMAGDSNAVDRLQAEIDKLESRQDQMKRCNAAIRKHAKAGPPAQTLALEELGLPESVAIELLKPDHCGRVGFADYEIRNNGANIRRLRARLEQIGAAKATPDDVTAGPDGLRLEDSPADNRVRLFFPGKPDAAIRAGLKSAGFRWAPTIGCWQAYRNHGSLSHARQLVGVA